jgi:3-carboxy-cis,cis-muconate cycloisomerase
VDGAYLSAMLAVETALARVQARLGLLTGAEASAVAAACADFDGAGLGEAAAASGNPVVPLVARLKQTAPAVHKGATSQDILDTATMLVARDALDAILTDATAAAGLLADLARAHRDTVMPARTLLRQALPTTFGLKAAGWLTALDAAVQNLSELRATGLAVQFGGPAGTLTGFDATPEPPVARAATAGPVPPPGPASPSTIVPALETGPASETGPGPATGTVRAPAAVAGPAVMAGLAAELGLAEPVLPWHTDRTRIARLAAALGTLAGTVGKIGRDITLLAQDEVAEVVEAAPGGSSSMAHKRNPVAGVSMVAAAMRAPGLVATLFATMVQEHERAAGAWHAEWLPLRELLVTTGSAVAWLRAGLTGLTVDAATMRSHVDSLVSTLDGQLDLGAATALVDRALHRRAG